MVTLFADIRRIFRHGDWISGILGRSDGYFGGM